MNDDAVHIRIHFRHEGELVSDGVNVTFRSEHNKHHSDFIFFRRGFKELRVKIPWQTRMGWISEYEVHEEEWDPKLRNFKSCVFGSDENT